MVSRKDNGNLIWQLNTLSSHGLPLTTAFGNGLTTTYGYDMDQLTQITTGTVQNETYTVNHPNIGNLMYRKDNLTSQYENFTYDNLDRLTGITYSTQPIQSINYSGNGNIASKYNGGTYAYDATKVHAVTSVTKTHGTASQALQDITYTKFNKAESITQYTTTIPTKTQTYALTYGPDEQRVKSIYIDTVNTKTIRFYAGNYQKDTTNGTSKKIHYIMGGTGLVAVYIKKNTDSGNLYYVCTDRQGSITALLKPDGSVAEKYSYDAYGRRRNPINWTDYNVPAPTLINRGYTGHEHLDGFGLINMNGRMYDPVIGRVLSPDVAVQAPGYTQSYNRYSYCMNNPLRYTDPSGYTYLENMKDWYDYDGGGFYYRGSYYNYSSGSGTFGSSDGGNLGGRGLYYENGNWWNNGQLTTLNYITNNNSADVTHYSWNPLGGNEVYRESGVGYVNIYYEGSWVADRKVSNTPTGGGANVWDYISNGASVASGYPTIRGTWAYNDYGGDVRWTGKNGNNYKLSLVKNNGGYVRSMNYAQKAARLTRGLGNGLTYISIGATTVSTVNAVVNGTDNTSTWTNAVIGIGGGALTLFAAPAVVTGAAIVGVAWGVGQLFYGVEINGWIDRNAGFEGGILKQLGY